MSNALIFLLGASTAAPIRWGRIEDGRLLEGGRLENAGDLSGLSGAASAPDAIVAILPGEQVALRRMPAPPKADSKFRSAAAYLLEDELADPIGDLHVAVAMREGDGLAIAVRKRIVEEWLAAFADAGLEPTLLTADYLLLPSGAGQATAIFEEDRAIIAVGGGGFAIETALLPDIARSAFGERPERLTWYGDRAAARLLPDAGAAEWLGPADDANLLAFYGALLDERAPPNLLQGDYRRRRAWAPALAPWRRSGALLAASLAAFAVFTIADTVRAGRTAERLEQASLAIHQRVFPDAANKNPAAHARQILGSGGGGGSFLELAARFAESVEVDNKVQIDRVSFDAARGEIVVSVRSNSDVDIEALKTRLAERGVAARDNGGYRRSGAHWIGELAAVTR